MTTVRVDPHTAYPTHHISLTNGHETLGLILSDTAGNATALAITRAPVPRTALKTTTGNQSYSDFEPPWTPIAQDDWSGGRAQDDFNRDSTKFFDAYRSNTMTGPIILGPQDVYTGGYRSMNSYMPGSVSWTALLGDKKYLAVKVYVETAYTARNIYLLVKRVGTPTAALTVKLCPDSSGSPGAALKTVTLTTTTVTDIVSELRKLTLSSGEALSDTTFYWVMAYSTAGDDKNHWEVGVDPTVPNNITKQSADASTWEDCAIGLYYLLTTADVAKEFKFFQYKQAQYAVTQYSTTVQVWINGDRGAADANTGNLNKVIDATKSWTDDEFVGAKVLIVEGTGRSEKTPWRTITDNDATTLTVDTDWVIEHDTTTAYVIVGADTWREITGHGLTILPTDIAIINGICYFCQGEDIVMRRMRWLYSIDHQWAADGTNKRDALCLVYDVTDGLTVYSSENKNIRVSKDSARAWGTDLSFTGVVTFQDDFGNITSLASYGDTSETLWIFREGAVFYLSSGKALEIQLSEMHNVKTDTNGKSNLVHNVYLYFNLGSGIERYYNRTLDDVGPNQDEGLPSGRQGIVSKMVGYPGKYFVAIDAGASGYSSILAHNGVGWHEVYRAPYGERIRDMQFQTVPGDVLDRLWVQAGENIIWLGFPSMTTNPMKDSYYRFTHEGVVESSDMYAGLYDVFKFYKSIKLVTENLAADAQEIYIDYRIDNDTAWTPIENAWTESPIQDNNLVSELGITGKRLRYRLRIQTNDNTITPEVRAAILECVTRVPVKYSYTLPHRMTDEDVDLNGEPDPMLAEDKLLILDEWATSLTPLVMRSIYKPFDNKTVFIDPQSITPYRQQSGGYIGRLNVIEV